MNKQNCTIKLVDEIILKGYKNFNYFTETTGKYFPAYELI